MKDSFGREISYMRISVTDRCNLRCRYCMPEGIKLVPPEEILTFEEIVGVCEAAAELGIRCFKITGGEPLVRPECAKLIGMLKKIPGTEQVTLTTNGLLLGKYLDELLENGLDAVNISLDTLNEEIYRRITGFYGLESVKENLQKAADKKLRVKVNSVLQRGFNAQEWRALLELARETRIDVRFIEMMPIGYGRACEGVPGTEVLAELMEKYPGTKKDETVHGNGPAVYYRIPGFVGSIGFISAVHGRFCDTCNRLRLTAEGELKPCLCYDTGVDIKAVLRDVSGSNREKLKKTLQEAVSLKPRMHCFGERERITEERPMVQIGG